MSTMPGGATTGAPDTSPAAGGAGTVPTPGVTGEDMTAPTGGDTPAEAGGDDAMVEGGDSMTGADQQEAGADGDGAGGDTGIDPEAGAGGAMADDPDAPDASSDPPVVVDSPVVTFKPRVIHTTDLGADPDDEMSMVRHYAVSNWFDTEGLIVATGCWRKSQSNTGMLDALNNAYAQVVDNLQVHDPEYPSLEYVQSISMMGQRGYGMGDVGDGKDSPGSELIIASVDKDDPRPVWATCWGGCNTIAQALWKVQNTRSPEELAEFVSKLHVYDILGQDNAGTWIAKTFPDIIYIRAKSVYNWQPSDGWVDTHVQSHGPLGAAYPDPPFVYEGDSPAIFHLIPNGLHDPTKVDQGGWGGRFASAKKTGIRGMSCMSGEDQAYDPYGMYNEASESIGRWKEALQNDFEARMDWSVTSSYADANHHPIAILNGDTTRQVMEISAAAGSGVELSADGSSDPDSNGLSYSWWMYDEPSSYNGDVTIQGGSSSAATVEVPANASGQNIHVVLEVVDDGSPNLTAYRRVIINVQ
jgi:hypothetical protein